MRQKKQTRNNVSVWNPKVIPLWHTSSSMATLPRPSQTAPPMENQTFKCQDYGGHSHSNHHSLFIKSFAVAVLRSSPSSKEGSLHRTINNEAETWGTTGIMGSCVLMTVMWLLTLPFLACKISQLNQPIFLLSPNHCRSIFPLTPCRVSFLW